MYSSIYLYRCMDRYIHTYPYIYLFLVLALPLALFLGLARPLTLSLSRALVLSAIALSRSCSLALLLTRSLFSSLSRSRSHLSRTHTHTCCSHTSCLFRRLPFHSLSLTLCLNQLMIPKQCESTCDTCCLGLGGGVTRVTQGEYTRITTFFGIKPPLSRKAVSDCDVIYVHMSIKSMSYSTCCSVSQRIAACRSVSQRVALLRPFIHGKQLHLACYMRLHALSPCHLNYPGAMF